MIKVKLSILLLFVIFFGGCASKIMQSYVGRDIRMAVIDYGPPANAFDMGNGTRAFQWVMHQSYTTPTYVSSNSYGSGYGTVTGTRFGSSFRGNIDTSSWTSTNTVIYGGQTISSRCIYTAFAKWNKQRKAWIVTGFKKPNLLCE